MSILTFSCYWPKQSKKRHYKNFKIQKIFFNSFILSLFKYLKTKKLEGWIWNRKRKGHLYKPSLYMIFILTWYNPMWTSWLNIFKLVVKSRYWKLETCFLHFELLTDMRIIASMASLIEEPPLLYTLWIHVSDMV